MYRIKFLLGSMATVFSLVYMLFGLVGWWRGDASTQDILTCFVLASAHLVGGGALLIACLRDFRRERKRVESVIRHMLRTNDGRIVVADLARYAELTEDDAREYLDRRLKHDVAFVTQGRTGSDVYYFGQQYWNN